MSDVFLLAAIHATFLDIILIMLLNFIGLSVRLLVSMLDYLVHAVVEWIVKDCFRYFFADYLFIIWIRHIFYTFLLFLLFISIFSLCILCIIFYFFRHLCQCPHKSNKNIITSL
jgi:hypothetical protein